MFRFLIPVAACSLLIAVQPQSVEAQTQTASRSATKATAAAGVMVNLNTASAADFEALPGIGAKTAARIVEYRQKNGPFKKIEELMNVRGIGEKNFLKLKPQLTVAAKAEAGAPRQN